MVLASQYHSLAGQYHSLASHYHSLAGRHEHHLLLIADEPRLGLDCEGSAAAGAQALARALRARLQLVTCNL